ncbi:unnamed protein product [Strongylus vulgaris]|uniref:Uncharacterized protein n=1 Tax=Strongylus vulgaris TaxID=40348 RepID=A0A3P7IMJ9_STRVU|nr:unnamed protein product [Strongylus vulgaris]
MCRVCVGVRACDLGYLLDTVGCSVLIRVFVCGSGVASSAAFSAMAAKCAGAYSLAALHLEGDAFESTVVVRRLDTDGNDAALPGLVHRTCSLNRHPLAHTTDHPKRPLTGSHGGVGFSEFVDLKQSISCDF